MNSTKNILIERTQLFIQNYQHNFGDYPSTEMMLGIPSPCIIKTKELAVFWQPVLMQPEKQLTLVEEAFQIRIQSEIHQFYGSQYSADLSAKFAQLNLNLIQVWNDEDFERLEKNLMAHLSMQQQLKRSPTLFIATTDDDTKIIAVDNISSAVVQEDLISGEKQQLSASLYDFLNNIHIG